MNTYNPLLNKSDEGFSDDDQNRGTMNQEEKDLAYKAEIMKLKYASHCGVVVKGIKETLRAIKSQKAKVVYLASFCEVRDYKEIIEEYCELFKVKMIMVNDWKEIRDAVIEGLPSEILIEKARSKGRIPKITPKCYSAAIINYGDISYKIYEINKKNG